MDCDELEKRVDGDSIGDSMPSTSTQELFVGTLCSYLLVCSSNLKSRC
jgi:hypothetical protein